MAFGTLVHGALQAAGEAAKRGEAMDSEVLMRRFEADLAAMRDLTENERRLLAEQGEFVLPRWWAANGEKLAAKDAAVEKWFNYEKDGVRLRGKVDRIEGGGEGRTVVDFKTGKAGGAKSEKTYKAQLQLYIYKLLVESEPGGPVVGGRVEFVAADGDGRVSKALELEFGREEEELVWQLVGVIWRRIMAMDFGEALEAAETGAASFRQFLENKIKAFM
ncbi:PD-(D/E)XK nuclease family protein [Candidatus Saccharibacteria bacterium]|nr:PD-(D/E)XK nuclease family protein [Candidatus Saccharibacteria bacterium]